METRISAFVLAVSLLFISVSSQKTEVSNPADQLVKVLNGNRSASESTGLPSNAGLGCIALQYIKAFKGDCGSVNDKAKRPADKDINDTFAPTCGVDPSTLAPLTARPIITCQSKYVEPEIAFSTLLVRSVKNLETIQSNNHTQVGAGVSATDGKSPYFWCLLFSNGAASKTFILKGDVVPKEAGPGCFSGKNVNCTLTVDDDNSVAGVQSRTWVVAVAVLAAYVFGI